MRAAPLVGPLGSVQQVWYTKRLERLYRGDSEDVTKKKYQCALGNIPFCIIQ